MNSMRKPSPQLLDLLADCSPGVTHLALALRELVLTEAPEAEEVLYSVYAQVIVFKLSGRKRGAFLQHRRLCASREPGLLLRRGIARPTWCVKRHGEEDASYPVRLARRPASQLFADLYTFCHRAGWSRRAHKEVSKEK